MGYSDIREQLGDRCRDVRLHILEEVEVAGSGHYGSALSCVEILVSLYYGYLTIRPHEPDWPARDRFVLSKGHACTALYPILADLGYFPREWLRRSPVSARTLGTTQT